MTDKSPKLGSFNARKLVAAVLVFVLAAGAWWLAPYGHAIAALISSPDGSIRTAPEAPFVEVRLEESSERSANASLGDFDGDGDLDIVLAKGRHWPLAEVVLLNDGKGNFDDRSELDAEPDRTYTAALADIDADDDLDLVVGNDRPDHKRVYKNDGKGAFALDGTFGEPTWATRNVTVVELTGDGLPEIVVANRNPKNQSANYICINGGNGTFAECRELSTESATTIASGDFNSDGFADLIVPHRDRGQSYVYINDGKGGFADRRAVGPAESSTRSVAVADLNGDSHQDILIGDPHAGGVRVYLNDGNADFAASFALGEDMGHVYAIAVADIDGDGVPDIVAARSDAPNVVYLGRGF